MSLSIPGTGAMALPSGSTLAVAPSTGDRSLAIATMSKFMDEFAASLVGNGYQKLPSGLIIQWFGTSNIASGANSVETLPLAFPHGLLGVVTTFVQGTDIAAGGAYVGQIRSYTTTTVTVRNLGPSTAGYNVIAIGW